MKDFIDELLVLKDYKDTLTKYAGIMTEFEKATHTNRIAAYRDEIHDRVIDGTLQNWNNAIANYQGKQAAYENAKKAEAARFDNVRLAAEIQAANTLVGMVVNQPDNAFIKSQKADKVQALYQDAVQSGDVNKARAIMEVVSNLPQKDLMPLARQAKNDLARLRSTEQITQAEIEVKQAANDLKTNSRALVVKCAEILGESVSPFGNSGPLSKALARVREDETGQLEILAENDPRVTGVRMPEAV